MFIKNISFFFHLAIYSNFKKKMDYYLLTLGNIHCKSCGSTIKKLLGPYLEKEAEKTSPTIHDQTIPSGWDISISIPEKTILMTLPTSSPGSSSPSENSKSNDKLPNALSKMVSALTNAGFQVLEIEKIKQSDISAQNEEATAVSINDGEQSHSGDHPSSVSGYYWSIPWTSPMSPFKKWNMKRTHRQYCEQCRLHHDHHSTPNESSSEKIEKGDSAQSSWWSKTVSSNTLLPKSLTGSSKSVSRIESTTSNDGTLRFDTATQDQRLFSFSSRGSSTIAPESSNDEDFVVVTPSGTESPVNDSDSNNYLYRATFAISGMSCSSCSNAITAGVRDNFPEFFGPGAGSDTGAFAVDLLNHSAVAAFPGTSSGETGAKDFAEKIKQVIYDLGYDCEVVDVVKVTNKIPSAGINNKTRSTTKKHSVPPKVDISGPRLYKIIASLGGMTCASCSNSITQNVLSLEAPAGSEFTKVKVQDAKVSLMDHSGTFIVEVEPKPSSSSDNTPETDLLKQYKSSVVSILKENVEDSGYDFDLDSIIDITAPLISQNDQQTETQSGLDDDGKYIQEPKTATLSVSGMFCE